MAIGKNLGAQVARFHFDEGVALEGAALLMQANDRAARVGKVLGRVADTAVANREHHASVTGEDDTRTVVTAWCSTRHLGIDRLQVAQFTAVVAQASAG